MTPAIRRAVVVIAVCAGLVGAAALGYAQGQRGAPPGLPARPDVPLVAPTILSGVEIGFRVESWRGETPVGRLIVKIDGKWVEVEFTTGFRKLSTPR